MINYPTELIDRTFAMAWNGLQEKIGSLHLGTRTKGAFQFGVGVVGIGGSVLALGAGPIGVALATFSATSAVDNLIAGFATVWTGQEQSTMFNKTILSVGESAGWFGETRASLIESVVDIGPTVAPRLMSALTKGELSLTNAASRYGSLKNENALINSSSRYLDLTDMTLCSVDAGNNLKIVFDSTLGQKSPNLTYNSSLSDLLNTNGFYKSPSFKEIEKILPNGPFIEARTIK